MIVAQFMYSNIIDHTCRARVSKNVYTVALLNVIWTSGSDSSAFLYRSSNKNGGGPTTVLASKRIIWTV